MNSVRTWMLLTVLACFGFIVSGTAAEDPEFEFRFDETDSESEDGEGSVDPEMTIDLKVAIENYLDEPREYELLITNSEDLESNGLVACWSSDGNDDFNCESTQLPAVDVSSNSVQYGLTVTIEATENALYGTFNVDIRCRDKENSDDEANKQFISLTINVNERAEVSIIVADEGSNEGSIDIGGETTYQIKVRNDGNKQDTISIETSLNNWDSNFNDNSLTIDAFSSKIVTLTIKAENDVNYGNSDDVRITGTSDNDGSVQGILDITTHVRVYYGIGLTPMSTNVAGQPGDTVTFNFNVLNKWSDSINYEIIMVQMYQGSPDNPADGWQFSDGTGTLEKYTETSQAKVSIGISSGADAGDVVTIVVKGKVSGDNEDIGAVQLEIEVSVQGEYNVQIVLPQEDTINLDAGKTVSISQYVKVKNFADVSDLVDITANWEMGGNDWELTVPDSITIEAGGEKPIYLSVKAPDSAAGNQAMLKINVQSNGDASKSDETTITFQVNSAATTAGPETEKLAEEGGMPQSTIMGLVGLVLILGLGSTAVYGLQQKSKGAFGGSENQVDDFSDEWAGMEGGAGAAVPQAPPPAPAPPAPAAAPPPATTAPPSTAAIPTS